MQKQKNTSQISQEITELEIQKSKIIQEIKQLKSERKKAEILFHLNMFNSFNPGASKIWN
jgi:hypothetical protein